MPEPPIVDPRLPADLAQALARQARVDVPDWRPPPHGDPGTALQQVLAQMVGHVVERVNRVPTHAFRSFLEAAGIQTLAPRPARAAVTFGLAPGGGATVVPAGTQVEAPGEAGRPPVVFETDADLTVLPLRLDVLEVWDPVSDRLTTAGGGVDGDFAAFSGVHPVRHDLRLTSPALRAAEPGSRVLLQVDLRCSLAKAELADLVSTLALEQVGAGDVVTPLASAVTGAQRTATMARLEATATSPGVPSVLHLVVGGTLAEHPFSRGCTVESTEVRVEAGPRSPAGLMVDGAPVDPATAFAALGEVPHVGSELAIADPLLGVPGATVTLDLALDPGVAKSAVLEWDWYDGTSWQPFARPVEDETAVLTESGTFTIHTHGVPASELRGSPGCWARVRLVSGGYGRPRAYVPINPENLQQGLKVEAGTGDLDAPRVLSLTLHALVADAQPTVSRSTGRHVVPAIGEPLAAGLDDLDPVSGTSGQAVVLGLDGDPDNRQVTLHLSLVDPPRPPRGRSSASGRTALQWEYLDGRQWQSLTVVDGTEGMTRTGVVSFLAPRKLAALALPGHPALRWVRVRSVDAVAPWSSPRLAGVTPNAVTVTAGQAVAWETVGQADGRESARFRLAGAPVMPGQHVLVAEPDPPPGAAVASPEEDGGPALAERTDDATGRLRTWVRWQEVRTLALSLPGDRHYVFDHAAGEIAFGDGVHGKAPPRGAAIAATYRHGAGAAGNVRGAALSRMRSGVPGIATVRGVQDADGGSDPGDTAEVERRGPAALRHRGRAVTATDICAVASEAAGGRVARCIVSHTDDRGRVSLVVVPAAPAEPAPSPSPTLRALIERELAERAAVAVQLATGIQVTGPSYRQVTVATEVVPTDPDQAQTVKGQVLVALTRFVHALTGGPAGTGWPLGRDVFESEVAQVLSAVPGVASVRSIRLSSSAAAQRLTLGSPVPAGLGLAVGSPVTDGAGRMVWTLDEPLPPGTRPEAVVLRGLTEGDRVHVLADATVVGRRSTKTGPEGLTLRLDHPAHVDVVFPIGSPLASPDGTFTFQLTRPVGLAASLAEVTVEGRAEGDLPALSERLTLVHPQELRVIGVEPTVAGEQLVVVLAADVGDHVVPGAVLGLVGHPARSPVLAATAVPGGLRVIAPAWRSGDVVRLDEQHGPRRGVVAQARVLDDVVHVDPGSLVCSGPHVIDLVAW